MKLTPSLLFTAGVLALTGCSTPTKVDSGTLRATTFNFVKTAPKAQSTAVDETAAVHAAVQRAITSNMASRGVSRVDSGGDLTVAYLLIIGDNVSTTYINDYFGYTEDLDKIQDKAHSAYTGANSRGSFYAGTLLIDIVDPKEGKLLKRGYATRPVLQNPSETERAANVDGAVNDILKDLRVER